MSPSASVDWTVAVDEELAESEPLGLGVQELRLCWNGATPEELDIPGFSPNPEGDSASYTFMVAGANNTLWLQASIDTDDGIVNSRLVWSPEEPIALGDASLVTSAFLAFIQCMSHVDEAVASDVATTLGVRSQISDPRPFREAVAMAADIRLRLIVAEDQNGEPHVYLFATDPPGDGS